jgi:NADH dehydrogenase
LPFHYKDKGSLATIGRSSAVADLGRVKLSGPPAWLAWLFLHVLFLVGFRNRVMVLLQWAWSFISYDRGARLITGPLRRSTDAAAAAASAAPVESGLGSAAPTEAAASPAARSLAKLG